MIYFKIYLLGCLCSSILMLLISNKNKTGRLKKLFDRDGLSNFYDEKFLLTLYSTLSILISWFALLFFINSYIRIIVHMVQYKKSYKESRTWWENKRN